ncbi:MAG TPA: MFS transporter [Casimicrobiaceae bacterium]|nr:MFS transporter [Casimicrobiaceae bacterium]
MSQITPQRRLAGGAIGAFVEWYDFHVYGLSAPALALHFFPKTDPTAALLSTFAVYALAFLARPLGGPFFGYLGDRHGRMNILSVTVLLMGAATMITGLLPTYDAYGIVAPALLVLCRVAQGCFAAGETSGALSYVLESAPEKRRARWAALIGGWGFLPVAVAAVLIYALRAGIGDNAYTEWGWRIPFVFGGVLGVVGLWLRRRLDDPEEYAQARRENPNLNPIRSVATSTRRSTINVVFLTALQAVAAYILLGYMYTFLLQTAKLSTTAALLTNGAANVLIFVFLPIFGAVADRVGRRMLLFAGAIWLLVSAYPAFALASTGTVAGAILGQLLLVIGFSMYAGGSFAATLELFPTSMRQSGHALAYNLGFAIFGGFTPLLAASLVATTHSPVSPAFFLMAIAVLGVITVIFTPETKGIRLRSSVQGEVNVRPEGPRLAA